MDHYRITFLALIDGREPVTGETGIISSEFQPGAVISALRAFYKNTQGLIVEDVSFLNVEVISSEEYHKASISFIALSE